MNIKIALILLLFLLALSAKAHAYIDPATGSLVLQVLSGMLVGVLLFFRRIRETISKFINFFKNKP